jgi:hypothetical protein
MGHTINPVSLRLGFSRYWNSIWCLSNLSNYSQLATQDFYIRKITIRFFRKMFSKRSVNFRYVLNNMRILRQYNKTSLIISLFEARRKRRTLLIRKALRRLLYRWQCINAASKWKKKKFFKKKHFFKRSLLNIPFFIKDTLSVKRYSKKWKRFRSKFRFFKKKLELTRYLSYLFWLKQTRNEFISTKPLLSGKIPNNFDTLVERSEAQLPNFGYFAVNTSFTSWLRLYYHWRNCLNVTKDKITSEYSITVLENKFCNKNKRRKLRSILSFLRLLQNQRIRWLKGITVKREVSSNFNKKWKKKVSIKKINFYNSLILSLLLIPGKKKAIVKKPVLVKKKEEFGDDLTKIKSKTLREFVRKQLLHRKYLAFRAQQERERKARVKAIKNKRKKALFKRPLKPKTLLLRDILNYRSKSGFFVTRPYMRMLKRKRKTLKLRYSKELTFVMRMRILYKLLKNIVTITFKKSLQAFWFYFKSSICLLLSPFLKGLTPNNILIVGLKSTTINAEFILNFIQESIKQHFVIMQVLGRVWKALNRLIHKKILYGYRVQLAGRFKRSEKAVFLMKSIGSIGRSDVKRKVDYSQGFIKQKLGVTGIKIWLSYANNYDMRRKSIRNKLQSRKTVAWKLNKKLYRVPVSIVKPQASMKLLFSISNELKKKSWRRKLLINNLSTINLKNKKNLFNLKISRSLYNKYKYLY